MRPPWMCPRATRWSIRYWTSNRAMWSCKYPARTSSAVFTKARNCCKRSLRAEKPQPQKNLRPRLRRQRKATMAISFNASALLNGNGIDVKSVVNAILNQQTGPLVDWQNQQTDLSTQAGLLAGPNSNLTNL